MRTTVVGLKRMAWRGQCRLDQLPPCLQSQFGRCCHLRGWGPALVERAAALSVVVRWGPLRTSVNGTLVARPLRTTPSNPSCLRFHPDRRVRPVLGDYRLVGKSLEGSRQRVGKLELPCLVIRAHRPHAAPMGESGC
jgi:hypothetical protein